LTEGQDVRVKVTEIDNRGRVKLSIKEAQIEEGTVPEKAPAPAAESAPAADATPESEPEA
jgi:polyribonucleotide nucleotidyltransferase